MYDCVSVLYICAGVFASLVPSSIIGRWNYRQMKLAQNIGSHGLYGSPGLVMGKLEEGKGGRGWERNASILCVTKEIVLLWASDLYILYGFLLICCWTLSLSSHWTTNIASLFVPNILYHFEAYFLPWIASDIMEDVFLCWACTYRTLSLITLGLVQQLFCCITLCHHYIILCHHYITERGCREEFIIIGLS